MTSAGTSEPGATSEAAGTPEPGAAGLPAVSGRLVWLMAVATGAIVANLYYAQPLLHQIARTFHAGAGATSLVVTCSQAGYAGALVFVLPLGDRHPRRRILALVYTLSVGGLVACALAPSLWIFQVAALATGLASVGGQVMVPFAADLAPPERRGRVVARLMTGLLTGILVARTLAGVVSDLFGWRAIYWLSAALMAVFAVVLGLALPAEGPRRSLPYRTLLAGTVRLFLDEPVLRRRAWYGATAFGSFSVLWTALAFLLSGPPFRYSSLVIGLFGLAGVGGVVAASVAGKLADARRTQLATVLAALLTVAAFGALVAGRTSLAALLVGIVVLDVGAEGMHVVNQTIIYELAPQARSRVNSAYMTCFFAGGAISSGTAGAMYAAAGWTGVCGLGAGFGLLALAMAGFDRLRPARSAAGPAGVSPRSGAARSPAPTPAPPEPAAGPAAPG